jgi:spore maturation protein SpmA
MFCFFTLLRPRNLHSIMISDVLNLYQFPRVSYTHKTVGKIKINVFKSSLGLKSEKTVVGICLAENVAHSIRRNWH